MRTLSLVVILLSMGAVGYYFGSRDSEETKEPDSVVEVRDNPSVVQAVKRLARLEGAALHMERVIDLQEKQSRFFGLIEARDAILLIASGDVTAGVDLSALRGDDVKVDHIKKRVEIHLPEATIFSVRLDNDRTYVHTRSTDVLAKEQTHLETKARKEAERGFLGAAKEAGIEDLARMSVARTVRALVLSLGFSEVEIVFAGAPEESAK